MKIFGKDKVVYYFSPDNKPAYFAEDGETFWVETDDCYGGQIKTANDLRTQIDISIMDAAVGPISISNATPADTLCVEVMDIQFASQGVMVTSVGLGVLGKMIKTPNTKIIKIKDGYAHFSDRIKLPLTPMIGVMGVSPKEGRIHCATPGNHGGNMDTKEIKIGSKIYLPVFVEGADLGISDLHACMGDGELSGTGIETAGRVCLKVSVIKNKRKARPIIETADSIYTLATEATYQEAIEVAVADMVAILQEKLQLEFPDAYRLLSATCDIGISQVVNGVYTLKVRAPRYVIKNESVF
ncbi:acetamidase/formamidase family protein [Xanthobacteraceae bacterium Astr-EGSB]|uniref:acetamidase/formamidase family protein n=1 Tax=Astrobacterium formosum TaxID=3069710 RepID=UPI0027B3041C|nr:acetamidase/formamidase family protein [Xanthobacteraceae bacterium Astr-EGSB]